MGNKIILYWEKSRNGITLILIFYLSIGRPSYLLRLIRNGELRQCVILPLYISLNDE